MRDTHAQRGGRRLRCTCPHPVDARAGLEIRREVDDDCPVHGTCAVQGHLDGGDGCYCGAR